MSSQLLVVFVLEGKAMLAMQVVASITLSADMRGVLVLRRSDGYHSLQEEGEDGMRPLVSVDEQARENAPSPGIRANESRTCTVLAPPLVMFARMGCLSCTSDRVFAWLWM